MITIFETFSGYGTASFALKEIGVPFSIAGWSDTDKYAIKVFEQNHGGTNYGDISKVKWAEVPDFDLITGGFPCQDVSTAGKQDLTGGRTVLGYELIDALKIKQPRFFLFENVKGLTNKKFDAFRKDLIGKLGQCGYVVFCRVLNTRDFGVPQNRERVWFVGFRKDIWNQRGEIVFNWPKEQELSLKLKDILESEVDEKYFISDERAKELIGKTKKDVSSTIDASYYKGPNTDNKANRTLIELTHGQPQGFRVYSPEGVSSTLAGNAGGVGGKTGLYAIGAAVRQRDRHGKNEEKEQQLELNSEEVANSLTSVQKDSLIFCGSIKTSGRENGIETRVIENEAGSLTTSIGNNQIQNIVAYDTQRIRRLTPKECFRLQGFLRDQINLEGISDTQCYKLAGNGQSLNVVTLLLREMLKGEYDE